MKYEKQLEQLGLSSNEASVYLACLELGVDRVSFIAKKAELPKSTTADILHLLNKKGYVSMQKKKNRQYFSASDPVILKSKIAQQADLIANLLPELNALYSTKKNNVNVRFFDNKEGFRVVSEEITKEADEILGFGSAEDMVQKMPEFFPNWANTRAKHKVRARILLRDTEMAKESLAIDKQVLRETRLFKVNIPFASFLILWKNKVAIMSLEDKPSVYIIEDKGASQTLKAIFEFVWATAE